MGRLQITASLIFIFIVGCSQETDTLPSISNNDDDTGRWYSQTQVENGEQLFQTWCTSCHGLNAEGTQKWKELSPDGVLPPPPLNGTAHAWHHPLAVLIEVIDQGGVALGGVMPGFNSHLNYQNKLDVIAFIQQYWPDNIYNQWLIREKAYRNN